MKIKLIRLFALALILALALSVGLVSCNGNEPDPDDKDDGPSDPNYPEDDIPLEGLILIQKNVAKFTVVTSSGAGSSAIRAAGDLVAKLRGLGITVGDVINDKDAASVTDCEIIIGAGVKNRPDGCIVETNDVGPEGYVIKAVGNRIVIAGGTTNLTRDAVEIFTEKYLGITDETESRRNVAVSPTLNETVLTNYEIEKVSIAGNDLAGYVIACDKNDHGAYPFVTDAFKNIFSNAAGYHIEVVDMKDVAEGANKIVIRTVSDAGEDGFRVLVSGTDLIVECQVESLFLETAEEFISTNIAKKKGNVDFAAGFTWTKHVATICYNDFGAKGDGVTNDFLAIMRTHETANQTGQKVVAKAGCTYYIGQTWDDDVSANVKDEERTAAYQIPVMTDVDWKGAKFIIDDTVSGIHYTQRYGRFIFTLNSDDKGKSFTSDPEASNQISTIGENLSVKANATEIPWLADYLGTGEYFVTLKNTGHKDYVRYGGNQDEGYDRFIVLIVDGDGKVSPDTPVTHDFDKVTDVSYRSVDDKPITVENGVFVTKSMKTAEKDKNSTYTGYDAYSRGIRIGRSNATIKNIDHSITGEPTSKGYPYYGFITFYYAHNCTLTDSKLTGHRPYNSSASVIMGTYDLIIEYSNKVTIKNLTQYRDIKDSFYWGISASNGSRNMVFDNVVISRIDAHRGLWNMDIKNSTIGFAINIIGGGTVNITDTAKRVGSAFISLRGDYGATFNGTMNLKNCSLNGYNSWSSADGKFENNKSWVSQVYVIHADYSTSTKYLNWNFGYTCYMPQHVVIDNFTSSVSAKYVYNDIDNSAFASSTKNKYVKTQDITFKNMSKLTICPNPSCSTLRGITVK